MFVVFSSLAALIGLFQHSGYAFFKLIHHILVEAHHTKLFSNKVFPLNSVLQIVRFTALF